MDTTNDLAFHFSFDFCVHILDTALVNVKVSDTLKNNTKAVNVEFEIIVILKYGTGRKQCYGSGPGSGAFLNPGSGIRIRYLG